MKHVLQLIETGGPGGAEHVLLHLSQRLNSTEDFRISAGTFKEGWLQAQLLESGIPVEIFHEKFPLDLQFLLKLIRYIKRNGIQLIHSHEFQMNLYAALVGRFLGIPVVATVHGKHHYPNAKRRIWVMRMLNRLGAQVVAVSADLRDFLQDDLGLTNVRTISNGIDVSAYTPDDSSDLRAELGLNDEAVIIGTTGSLYQVKGHALLFEAVASLGIENVHVVLVGRGREEENLRKLAGELSLEGNVHFLGFRQDVPRLLSSFDIYALPSYSEGQSLALIEAMAACRAIVASRVGGNPELIRDGDSGLLFQTGDSADLAEKLGRFLADPEMRARMGAAAAVRARSEFSVETTTRNYCDLYREMGLGVDCK